MNNNKILRMEFIFDSEKLKENKMTEEQCLNIIRKYVSKYKITEISKGVFDSKDIENTDSFVHMVMNLPYTDWFLKVIKEWNWYIDGDKEDCLNAYYRTVVKNA